MAVKNTIGYFGIVAVLWAMMFAARPAAQQQWNRPGMLMVRSEVRLLLGDRAGAFRLAGEAAAQRAICTAAL